MKKIIIVLCVLVLSACGGGGKVDGTKIISSTMVPGTEECITIDHPEGQQEWTDIEYDKYGSYIIRHYKYKTVSCYTYK